MATAALEEAFHLQSGKALTAAVVKRLFRLFIVLLDCRVIKPLSGKDLTQEVWNVVVELESHPTFMLFRVTFVYIGA